MAHPKVVAFVLAGGKGERLFPLTVFRSKPSVPFGGRYRIVDFVLSSLINSGIYSIYLLVQYKSQSLIEHVRQNWSFSSVLKDHFVAVVPPQMRMGPEWFQGTADAVFQNVNIIQELNPDIVLIFGSDHIYRMDIQQMIDFHVENDALVTVAARPVPIEQASSFGIISADSQGRITGFQEKPKNPDNIPGDPTRAYCSMGNYLFNKETLINALAKAQKKKQHDFGSHVIPDLVKTGKVFAYDFSNNIIQGADDHEEKSYWRDVGTISAFFDAHMDMLGPKPVFNIDNRVWPLSHSGSEGPPARILNGHIKNSLIANGCVIGRAKIENCVIRSGVVIEDNVVLKDCIIFDDVVIKKGAKLNRVIVDKLNVIDADEQIGYDDTKDKFRCHIDVSGIRVIPKAGISRPRARF
ncbi:MAG: glucose-1-phosphate adenylyltransferase [Nitrospiraceae bacterium]|nr:glucose-1-phosphate adenylyltransferase [Nitrospiraceae bacterium]